jgi:hypothetical protein
MSDITVTLSQREASLIVSGLILFISELSQEPENASRDLSMEEITALALKIMPKIEKDVSE